MKLFILLLTISSAHAEEIIFTYENAWYVVYKDADNNTVSWPLQGAGRLENIPKTDCIVGTVEHKYYKPSDDNFSREVICYEGKKENELEKFKCSFDEKFKNEDGEEDKTRTVCSKQYKEFKIVLEINRYMRDVYWQLKERERNKNDTRSY